MTFVSEASGKTAEKFDNKKVVKLSILNLIKVSVELQFLDLRKH